MKGVITDVQESLALRKPGFGTIGLLEGVKRMDKASQAIVHKGYAIVESP